jgi:hypothetical protein
MSLTNTMQSRPYVTEYLCTVPGNAAGSTKGDPRVT